jgi:hypothetical protein
LVGSQNLCLGLKTGVEESWLGKEGTMVGNNWGGMGNNWSVVGNNWCSVDEWCRQVAGGH